MLRVEYLLQSLLANYDNNAKVFFRNQTIELEPDWIRIGLKDLKDLEIQ